MSEKQLEKKPKDLAKVTHEVQEVLETEDGTESFPKETEAKIEKVVTRVIQSEQFSGPIPHPDIIRKYEEILPGAAERIISMAEKQSNHRQDMEKLMIKAEVRDSFFGVIFAFLLGIGCIIAAIVLAIIIPGNGGAVVASIFGISGIGSLVGTFLKATRQLNNSTE